MNNNKLLVFSAGALFVSAVWLALLLLFILLLLKYIVYIIAAVVGYSFYIVFTNYLKVRRERHQEDKAWKKLEKDVMTAVYGPDPKQWRRANLDEDN